MSEKKAKEFGKINLIWPIFNVGRRKKKMKKILSLMVLMMMLVGAFAVPRLEGNKIYLDEAATNAFTAEQFVERVGGEEVLDVVDEAGNTKRMQLEYFCNPNKVIEFASEEMATQLFDICTFQKDVLHKEMLDRYLMSLPSSYTTVDESFDFLLFNFFSKECTTPGCTPTYCYVDAH